MEDQVYFQCKNYDNIQRIEKKEYVTEYNSAVHSVTLTDTSIHLVQKLQVL